MEGFGDRKNFWVGCRLHLLLLVGESTIAPISNNISNETDSKRISMRLMTCVSKVIKDSCTYHELDTSRRHKYPQKKSLLGVTS